MGDVTLKVGSCNVVCLNKDPRPYLARSPFKVCLRMTLASSGFRFLEFFLEYDWDVGEPVRGRGRKRSGGGR